MKQEQYDRLMMDRDWTMAVLALIAENLGITPADIQMSINIFNKERKGEL